MLKMHSYAITFAEVPDEVTLCLNISGCTHHCTGCHSSYLWEDVGDELTPSLLSEIIAPYKDYITCICFMGGDHDFGSLHELFLYLHENYRYKMAFYTGCNGDDIELMEFIRQDIERLDYLKTGPYVEKLGGLACKTTNQKMFRIHHVLANEPNAPRQTMYEYCCFEDITSHFWKEKL